MADRTQWIEAYKPLEKYVKANEQDSTLTYYFGTPVEHEGDHSSSPFMLAIEQYRVRDDLYKIHFSSEVMGEFLKKIPATMTTGLDLAHYEDVAGFLDKPGDMREAGIWYDTRITCKEQHQVIEGLKSVAKSVEEEEDGCYSFLVLKSLHDDKSVRIFERYQDDAALKKHRESKYLLDFFKSSKETISSMEGRGYVPNGYGWLHR